MKGYDIDEIAGPQSIHEDFDVWTPDELASRRIEAARNLRAHDELLRQIEKSHRDHPWPMPKLLRKR